MKIKKEHPHYAALYERYTFGWPLGHRRIMELGVAQGESLLGWKYWFPNAEVIGVDHRECPGVSEKTGCRIVVADQTDPVLLELGNFDLIVDDAGHDWVKQRQSLVMLWPKLNSGGVYVIEDLETSFWTEYDPQGWNAPDGVLAFLEDAVYELTAAYAKKMPSRFRGLEGLTAIHHHPNIVFIEKS